MPTIINHNATTNEITEEEIPEQVLEKLAANKAERDRQESQAAAAKVALLEKLGITEEEAKLLLS